MRIITLAGVAVCIQVILLLNISRKCLACNSRFQVLQLRKCTFLMVAWLKSHYGTPRRTSTYNILLTIRVSRPATNHMCRHANVVVVWYTSAVPAQWSAVQRRTKHGQGSLVPSAVLEEASVRLWPGASGRTTLQ